MYLEKKNAMYKQSIIQKDGDNIMMIIEFERSGIHTKSYSYQAVGHYFF